MKKSVLSGFMRVALLCLALVPAMGAAVPWPAVVSDLKADDRAVRGELPNGLRYVIMPNGEPKDRVSLRLLVAAGSLHEREEERGLAHFVEHMVFRGTRSHPADSLVKSLERIGIGIGPDNTAFTSYDHTIYHLELPRPQESTLRQCLNAFREYSEEVVFSPALMERERGVILSEAATRGKPDYYVNLANLNYLWPNCRQTTRVPIGLTEVINHCTRDQLLAFYDAWYRPERMAVIVVGTVDVRIAEKLIRETLGGLRGRGSPGENPPDEIPTVVSAPNVRIYAEPTYTGVTVVFEHPEPYSEGPDTQERRVDLMSQSLAFSIFQTRLSKYSSQFRGTFVDPQAWIDTTVPGWRRATILGASKATEWRRAAGDFEQEHRRAFLEGFSDGELTVAKAAYANSYDEASRVAESRPSDFLAGELVQCLLHGHVFAKPENIRRDVVPRIDALTAKDCTAAFRKAWGKISPHILIVTDPDFPTTSTQIAKELNESRLHATQDLIEKPALNFAYTDFGPAGELVHEETVADLDVKLAAFANGVRLNFKQTDFVADWVDVRVRVGTGKLSQPEWRPGLDILAGSALIGGGLRKHTARDLGDLLAGHSAYLGFHVESDAFVFTIQCARRDLRMALQLIAAFLTDAAYRPEVIPTARAQFSSLFASIEQSPGGPITQKARRILAAGDRRFGLPEPVELISCDLAALENWLEPHFKKGPIELSVVGDTEWKEVRQTVAETLGALPARPARTPPGKENTVRPPAPPKEPYLFASSHGIKQIAIAWAWTIPQIKDTHTERRYYLLASLLAERLRVRLREQLGAAYSPTASFSPEEGFTGASFILAYAEILPEQFRRACVLFRDEIKSLRENHISADEFARLKEPLLHMLRDERRTNSYWSTTVLGDAQQHRYRLDDSRNRESDYASIKPGEIEALAHECFAPRRAFIFVAAPRTQ